MAVPVMGVKSLGRGGGEEAVTMITSKKVKAEAEFAFKSHPFYCHLCPCVVAPPICCQADRIKERTYFRVFENRIEYNQPYSSCICIPEAVLPPNCIKDHIVTEYFDMGLSRNRSRCCCQLCSLNGCCGPPMLYNFKPHCGYMCLNCDYSTCYGEGIRYHSHSCRDWSCCGYPCAETRNFCGCAPFLLYGLKNSHDFLERWKNALDAYKEKYQKNVRDYQWTTFKITFWEDDTEDVDVTKVSTVI